MNYKHQLIKERFDIAIINPDSTVKGDFELDKHAQFLVGIAITSDREDLLFYRGSQRIQFNEKELFPENFESKLLMAGINVAPDNRMVSLENVPCGNGKLEVYYKDSTHPLSTFSPYRVTIYTFSINALNE